MIQRLQTVFLFLAAMINIFVYFTPIYARAMQDPAAWIGWLLAVTLACTVLMSGYSIFLFRDRNRQLWWVRMALLFQIAVLAAASAILFTLGGFGSFLMREALSVLLLFLALVSLWQAARFIRKDQELVDSMNRIR